MIERSGALKAKALCCATAGGEEVGNFLSHLCALQVRAVAAS